MGVRVDEKTLEERLQKAGREERRCLLYHQMLLSGKLPYTIDGGIGQSCFCVLPLDHTHAGEVQASIWPKETREERRESHISLL